MNTATVIAAATVAQQGTGTTFAPPTALARAVWAANDLRNWIAESDRTLAEHDAAIDNERLARIKLKAMLIATMADEDHPIVAGNVAWWLGGDGEVTSRAVPILPEDGVEISKF